MAEVVDSWSISSFGDDGVRLRDKLREVLLFGSRDESDPTCLFPSNAFDVAKLVDAKEFDDSLIAKRHVAFSRNLGLPASPAGAGPRSFISQCGNVQVGRASLDQYFKSADQYLVLMSKKGSLRPMASGLRAWGRFWDLLGEQHFLVSPVRAGQFAAVCREAGAYPQYITSKGRVRPH